MTEAQSASTEEDPELGTKVRKAMAWSVGNQVALRAASFLSGVVLARVLFPEDLGLFAVALAAMSILVAVNDMGVIVGIVRWPGAARDAAPTAFTLALISSLTLAGVAFIGAGPLATLMGSPEAAGLVRVMSLTIVIDGIVAVPLGGLVREFRQDLVARSELSAIPVGIGVSVGLAMMGAGAWSLAIGRVAGALVAGALLLWSSPLPIRFGWDRQIARTLLGFGLPLAGTTLVEELLLNLDYFIVGAVLGSTMLGFYALAFNLANWPISIMKEGIRRVSIAGFARLADERERLNEQFTKAVALIVTGALPMCLGLSILGASLIRVVYGPKWGTSATALGVLAFLGLALVTVGLFFDLLVALGRSKTTFALQATWLLTLAPTLYLVTESTQTIRGPAIAHVAIAYGVVVPLYLLAIHANGVPLVQLGRRLLRPLGAGCVAAAIMLFGRQVFEGPILELSFGVLGGIAYLAIVVPYADLQAWRTKRAQQASIDESGDPGGDADA